ncbi:MAG: phosphatidylglycerophosphatase A [Thermobacillus sp. ZCTH02-B1]|uniref:phosphatidylglycerophosphatase A n=1 Tax=Thermobacillus sp. ZCTH02-B1 TaxID=1858795 RepID=UPI000B567491|nr:phosphatidylglycerophosphatase A [Thermobacillus sp. ZCTH02-B1]OUM96136.1 MAG: phosphatidylglycerophosphatase A [Thermobacillus sp. ZCTH02-B1]
MTAAIEQWLERRGVTVRDVAEIVLSLQRPYNGRLTISDCEESVRAVLAKREVQYTLLTGIALDELADRGLLPEPLQRIMEEDESLYGVDETLALGIVSVYGMIGLTSFGYLDKMKPGVIGRLNGARGTGRGGSEARGEAGDGRVDEPRYRIHVFLDDLVSALAAAASARIAHQNPDARDYGLPGEG